MSFAEHFGKVFDHAAAAEKARNARQEPGKPDQPRP